MREERRKFETWNELIIDFFEYKVAKSNLYKAREYVDKKENDIAAEKDEKKRERLLKARNTKQRELEELRENSPSTEIREWIEKTAATKIAQGNRIIKATHALKFTHGSSASEGIFVAEKANDTVLTTSSFRKNLVTDLAHNNGALITISRFLALKLSHKTIIDLVLEDDFEFLVSFSKDQHQLDNWKNGLKNLVEQREINTADKAKQIYYPLINPGKQTSANYIKYHLIVPLFPSSLAEEIYTTITDLKYGKERKEVRNCKSFGDSAKKNPKYHYKSFVDIPNLGIQTFGGAQPQNISMLNKGRSWKAEKKDKTAWGMTYLFSAQAPTWETHLAPPVNRKSLFDNFSNSTINTELDYLRDFLLRFKQLDLSIKDPKRVRHLERWIDTIIDELLFYVGSIQNLSSGWSDRQGIKLKKEHQYLLDPYRMDAAFQSARQGCDWQAVIRADFAMWLNRRLRGKDKQFTPQKEHTRLWKKLLETPLREFMEPIEAELKQQARG